MHIVTVGTTMAENLGSLMSGGSLAFSCYCYIPVSPIRSVLLSPPLKINSGRRSRNAVSSPLGLDEGPQLVNFGTWWAYILVYTVADVYRLPSVNKVSSTAKL